MKTEKLEFGVTIVAVHAGTPEEFRDNIQAAIKDNPDKKINSIIGYAVLTPKSLDSEGAERIDKLRTQFGLEPVATALKI